MGDVDRALLDDGPRHESCRDDTEVVVEDHPGQHVELMSVQVADGRKLARGIAPVDPSPLDLVARPVWTGRIETAFEIWGLRPAERGAEEMLGEIPGGIVGAAQDASLAQLIGNSCVQLQKLRNAQLVQFMDAAPKIMPMSARLRRRPCSPSLAKAAIGGREDLVDQTLHEVFFGGLNVTISRTSVYLRLPGELSPSTLDHGYKIYSQEIQNRQ